jgi:hypothetical protein
MYLQIVFAIAVNILLSWYTERLVHFKENVHCCCTISDSSLPLSRAQVGLMNRPKWLNMRSSEDDSAVVQKCVRPVSWDLQTVGSIFNMTIRSTFYLSFSSLNKLLRCRLKSARWVRDWDRISWDQDLDLGCQDETINSQFWKVWLPSSGLEI